MVKYLTGGPPTVWYSKSMVGFGVRGANLTDTGVKKVADQFAWSHVLQKTRMNFRDHKGFHFLEISYTLRWKLHSIISKARGPAPR